MIDTLAYIGILTIIIGVIGFALYKTKKDRR
jgi:nucleoside permease NupC